MDPLSAEQRALVERHLGLVHTCVKRRLRRMPARLRRLQDDLLQEASVGLMRAAANYQADGHGPFVRYALVHIRSEICRFLLKQMAGLAMPRGEARRVVSRKIGAGRHSGSDPAGGISDDLPRFQTIDRSRPQLDSLAIRRANRQAAMEAGEGHFAGWSYQELHERFERAVRLAMTKLEPVYSERADGAALLRAVVEERMLVPDERYRVSRRRMAARFGCSARRVWRYETRLFGLVRDELAGEAVASCPAETLVRRPVEIADGLSQQRHYGTPDRPDRMDLFASATMRR
jgi:RNA polymerase sigma factor (sigma-70 family)